MVKLLLTANIIVFFLWFLLPPEVMYLNFTASWVNVAYGRVWTLLTSAFSHNLLFHILINMFVLASFGPPLENMLGRRRFTRFYLAAALVASLSHVLVSGWLMDEPALPALGASGAIAGLVMVFALTFPHATILLFGLVPMPAIWAVILFVALDIWGLIAQIGGGGLPIGHGAHLGGALTGWVYYKFFRQREPRRRLRSAWT